MSIRIERLQERIKARIAEALIHEISDPGMGFVTITGVELTGDLKFAKVLVSILGDESEQRTIMRTLARARGRIQGMVASSMRTRTTPQLEFVQDRSIERSFEVTGLLAQIEQERLERQAEAGGSAAETAESVDGEPPADDQEA